MAGKVDWYLSDKGGIPDKREAQGRWRYTLNRNILGDEIPSNAFNYAVNCHQIKHRLNTALIFTVTPMTGGLFALLKGCLFLLGEIIIVMH
jgi:hypothetical protein